MDENRQRIKDEQYRQGMSPIFIWIPAIISFVVIVFVLVLKFTEKFPNSFTSWAWVVAIILITVVFTFGMSIIIYLVTSIRNKKPLAVEYSTREECDIAIKSEIKRRTGYTLGDFTETGDSIEGNGYYGKRGQALIYFHVYRINKGALKRYVLGLKNMEKDKDLVILVQSPMNFVAIDEVIAKYAERLTPDQMRYSENENVFTDSVTGRTEIKRTRTPYEEQKKKDDEEDEEEQQ
jgi:hypothetical protein